MADNAAPWSRSGQKLAVRMWEVLPKHSAAKSALPKNLHLVELPAPHIPTTHVIVYIQWVLYNIYDFMF